MFQRLSVIFKLCSILTTVQKEPFGTESEPELLND